MRVSLFLVYTLLMTMITCLLNGSGALGRISEEEPLPDDHRAHFLTESSLAEGYGAAEWDNQILWLETPDHRHFSVWIGASLNSTHLSVFGQSTFLSYPSGVVIIQDLDLNQFDVENFNGVFNPIFEFFSTGDDPHRLLRTFRGETDGRIQLTSSQSYFDIQLTPLQPQTYFKQLPNSPDGWIGPGDFGSSVYLARTLQQAKGTMQIDGKILNVIGTAWNDRQWFSKPSCQLLKDRASMQRFAMQFREADGSSWQLMCFKIWDPSLPTRSDQYCARINQQGQAETFPKSNIRITPLNSHPSNLGDFPTHWEIVVSSNVPPGEQITLDLQYIYDSPWIKIPHAGYVGSFLEGAVRLNGTVSARNGLARPLEGKAWVEQSSTQWIRRTGQSLGENRDTQGDAQPSPRSNSERTH